MIIVIDNGNWSFGVIDAQNMLVAVVNASSGTVQLIDDKASRITSSLKVLGADGRLESGVIRELRDIGMYLGEDGRDPGTVQVFVLVDYPSPLGQTGPGRQQNTVVHNRRARGAMRLGGHQSETYLHDKDLWNTSPELADSGSIPLFEQRACTKVELSDKLISSSPLQNEIDCT